MENDWRSRARAEIGGIKPFWSSKYGWSPVTEESDGAVDLFVTFHRAREPGKRYVLRLRYEEDFETAGRREEFVNPDDRTQAGKAYWPVGVQGFQTGRTPLAICLEGTFGFHSGLHKERDGRLAVLNRLLMEVQKCLDM